jgi:uncharacterized membrane protein (UPF0182 family)
MTAFMVAKSDPDQYGQLETFVMPQSNRPDGPANVAATMSSDADVSSELSLLSREGSDVILGNLLVIPIEQSLLYVRPVYVEATSNRIPELERVIVAFGGTVEMRSTLREALIALFGDAPDTGEGGQDPGGEPEPTPDPDLEVEELLDQAAAAFEDAEAALADGDLGGYQRNVREGQELVERARELLTESSTTATTRPPGAA